MRAAVNMYHEKAQQELQDNHWLAAIGANIVVRHTAQSVSSVKSSCSSLIETGKINNNRLDRGTVPITVMLFASVLGNKRKQSRLAEGGEEAFMRDCSHDVGSTIYSAAVLLWWADVTLAHLLFARLQGVGSHRNLLNLHPHKLRLLSTCTCFVSHWLLALAKTWNLNYRNLSCVAAPSHFVQEFNNTHTAKNNHESEAQTDNHCSEY